MSAEQTPEKADAPRCCACTTRAVCFVLDGAFHKPACEQHGRMYRQQGHKVKPIAGHVNPPGDPT